MPIYHDQKLIFIHIPKAAGTSIRTLLNKTFGEGDKIRKEAHGHLEEVYREDYEVFCVVRDPISRAKSHYAWFRKHKDYHNFPHKELALKMSFQDWIHKWFIPEAREQSQFFLVDGKLPKNVAILKQENLNEDLQNYLGSLVDVSKLPHIYNTDDNGLKCDDGTLNLIKQKEHWLYDNGYYS